MSLKRAAFWKKAPDSPVFHPGQGVRIAEYRRCVPALAGTRLMFFSDTHIMPERNYCFPPAQSWSGVSLLRKALHDALKNYAPDILVFGGDLASRCVCLNETFDMLSGLPFTGLKLAITGNWERRQEWLKQDFWKKKYEAAGFVFLLNESYSSGGLFFYGFDDFKKGRPRRPAGLPKDQPVCFLTHNPDTVLLLPDSMLREDTTVLAGHTHGGQIRFPLVGALHTSSVTYKKFEYGLLTHTSGAQMIVSAGIGTSWYRLRILCPPEIVCVTFTK